jgi:predicted peptidase
MSGYSYMLIAVLMLFSSCGVKVREGLLARRIRTEAVREFGYNIFYPESYGKSGRKWPLFLWLHGAGERGSDNVSQLIHIVPYLASDLVQTKYPCIVVAPQCPAEDYWAPFRRFEWTIRDNGEVTPAMGSVITLMEKLLKDPRVDKSRVYVGGLSMGGFGTLDLLHRKPEWFAAAIPICGGADLQQTEKYKHIPLWVFHGAKDDVVKPELSRNLVAKLKSLGSHPRYTEYPDGGHDVWNSAIREPELMHWLFACKKDN